MNSAYYILFYLLLCSGILTGQIFPNFNFTIVNEANGLSHNYVNSITQDTKGYIWIATENGLNRYDGSRVKTYYKNQKPFNLSYNFIHEVYFINNKLWVTGLNNCNIFDSQYKTVVSKFYNNTCQLGFYTRDTLLTGFTDFYRYSQKSGIEAINHGLLPGKSYFRIIELNQNTYLGYYNNRIDILDQKDFNIIDSIILPKDFQIQQIVKDQNGKWWFGTWSQGLFNLDVASKRIQAFELGQDNINVTKLFPWTYQGRNYLIAAVNNKNGFVIIDLKTNNFKTLHEVTNNQIPIPLFVNSFYEDRDQNLWIGTDRGLFLFSNQNIFKIHNIPTPNRTSPNKSQVASLHVFEDEFWFTKRYADGLHIYDKHWNLKKYIAKLVTESGISDCIDTDGFDMIKEGDNVYLTGNCGLYKINFYTKKIQKYNVIGVAKPLLRNIARINNSEILIRSREKIIYKFNFAENRFKESYELKDQNNIPQIVSHIFTSSNNNLTYALSENNLFQFDNKTSNFINLSDTVLQNYRMLYAVDDKDGIFWISTFTGMIGYNLNKKKVTYTFSDQPDMSYMFESCVDSKSNIWFNCQKGYWCWLKNQNKMIRFGYHLGLPDNKVNGGITTDPSKNIIYAGAEDAVVEFRPELIMKYNINKKAIITGLVVNDIEKDYLLEINDDKKIELGSNERNVSLHFAVPDYSMNQNFEYFYKVNNQAWVKAVSGTINFNNLNPGTYIVEVKGRLIINDKETQTDQITLSIAPYWYESIWFKILLVVTVFGLLYYFYQRKIEMVRKEDELKSSYDKKFIELELANLRSQMNPHFIFNSLNSINSFIIDNETRLASDYLTKFSRLVRMILDNSKNEYITLEKELDTLSLYLIIEGLRFDNKFTYNIIVDEHVDTSMIKVPPMIIQPFVENAIWHGILPKKGGRVEIRLSKIEHDSLLKIAIIDNGIGREKASQLKTKSGSNEKSHGIQITSQRILGLSTKNNILITDIKKEDGSMGTMVEIIIDIL